MLSAVFSMADLVRAPEKNVLARKLTKLKVQKLYKELPTGNSRKKRSSL